MAGSYTHRGKGNYTLDGFRFYYNPDTPSKGMYEKPSIVKIKTQSANVVQSWTSHIGDEEQFFKWEVIDSTFFDELNSRYATTLSTPDTTFVLEYHELDRSFNIHITDLSFDPSKGVFRNVVLKFIILSEVV